MPSRFCSNVATSKQGNRKYKKPHSWVNELKSSDKEHTHSQTTNTFFQLPANACFKPEPAALMQRDNKIAIKTTRYKRNLFING